MFSWPFREHRVVPLATHIHRKDEVVNIHGMECPGNVTMANLEESTVSPPVMLLTLL